MTANNDQTSVSDLTPDEKYAVEKYLRDTYQGVFTEDAIAGHMENHAGFGFSNYAMQVVRPHLPEGGTLLDIGCGFGSCVLAARAHGYDARGVDLAEFEVHIARRRLSRARPELDPSEVFQAVDARALDLADATLDTVTLWNVIEHIADYKAVLGWIAKKLKPGGLVYIVCPNYAAWRLEAHYHVPWYPLLPRRWAARYLHRKGKNPRYFQESIFYRTNWGVLRALWRVGFSVFDIGNARCLDLSFANCGTLLRNWRLTLSHLAPMKDSVVLAARKV